MGNILPSLMGQQQNQPPPNYQYTGQPGPAGLHFGQGTVNQNQLAQGIMGIMPMGMVAGEATPALDAFDRESDKALGMIDDLLTKYGNNKEVSNKLSSYAEKLNDIGAMRDLAHGSKNSYVSDYAKVQGLDAKNFTPDMPSAYFKEFKDFVKGLGHDFDSYDSEKGLE